MRIDIKKAEPVKKTIEMEKYFKKTKEKQKKVFTIREEIAKLSDGIDPYLIPRQVL